MGGAGSAVAELLAAEGIAMPIQQLGLPDSWLEHASREQVLADAGLDGASVRIALLKRWPQLTASLASPKIAAG
jgi:1-deoxy-D-xylulose-5-phosphate synthase